MSDRSFRQMVGRPSAPPDALNQSVADHTLWWTIDYEKLEDLAPKVAVKMAVVAGTVAGSITETTIEEAAEIVH